MVLIEIKIFELYFGRLYKNESIYWIFVMVQTLRSDY